MRHEGKSVLFRLSVTLAITIAACQYTEVKSFGDVNSTSISKIKKELQNIRPPYGYSFPTESSSYVMLYYPSVILRPYTVEPEVSQKIEFDCLPCFFVKKHIKGMDFTQVYRKSYLEKVNIKIEQVQWDEIAIFTIAYKSAEERDVSVDYVVDKYPSPSDEGFIPMVESNPPRSEGERVLQEKRSKIALYDSIRFVRNFLPRADWVKDKELDPEAQLIASVKEAEWKQTELKRIIMSSYGTGDELLQLEWEILPTSPDPFPVPLGVSLQIFIEKRLIEPDIISIGRKLDLRRPLIFRVHFPVLQSKGYSLKNELFYEFELSSLKATPIRIHRHRDLQEEKVLVHSVISEPSS